MWQPIETAPKDGTKVDIWIEKLGERYQDCYFDGDYWVYTDGDLRCTFSATPPSHWTPSPGTPGESE